MNLIKRRRNLLVISTGLAALAALTYLSVTPGVTEAHIGDGALTLDVLVDIDGTLNSVHAPHGGGPFHVQGTIYPAGTFDMGVCPPDVNAIGNFHCWGVLNPADTPGPGLVSQEYNLVGLGKIQTQGQEGPTSIIAVVGGTGDFKYAQGEGTRRDQFVCTESPERRVAFTIDFDMIGVGH